MIYTCPICGEVYNEDVIATCQRCGSTDVREEVGVFICSNCGQVSEDAVVLSCRFCKGESEDLEYISSLRFKFASSFAVAHFKLCSHRSLKFVSLKTYKLINLSAEQGEARNL